MPETLTAPIAEIKVGTVTVGKAQNIRYQENHRRGNVVGIGRYTPDEAPALQFQGSLSCGFYTINFAKHPFLYDAILRKTDTLDKFVNTITLQEIGLQFKLQRKVSTGRDPQTHIIGSTIEEFATIEDCFIEGDGFDLNEGQISNRNSTFTVLTPAYYNV